MRQFTLTNKSWYAKYLKETDFAEEIIFGDSSFELAMRWYDLENNNPPTARLEIFQDSFTALNEFQDLFHSLAKLANQKITAEEFTNLLREHGFEDKTSYISPYKD